MVKGPPSSRSLRRCAPLLLGSVAALGLLAAALWAPVRKPVASRPIEILRKDLVLHEGRLIRAVDSAPFTGVVLESYENGGLKSRSCVSNGVLEGLSQGWHTNGQLQVLEYFRLGRSDGVRTKWYASGAKLSEAHVAEGKLQGRFRRWHEDGTLAEQVELKDGDPEGLSVAFYPSGFLKAQARLHRGKVVEQKFWNDGEKRGDPAIISPPPRG